jgi:hypothetical protein
MALIIVLAMLCLVVAMMAGAVSTFQLSAASRAQASNQALYLAEGAIAEAMSNLWQGMQPGAMPYGRPGNNADTIFSPYADRPDAQGVVTFNPMSPWGYSTNDYDGNKSYLTGWNGAAVPPGYVMLIACGTYGQATRIIEAYVTVPSYAYALSVDGALVASGSLNVRSEQSMQTLYNNSQAAAVGSPPATPQPGANVGSNTKITASSSLITGDVVCPNTSYISLGSPSMVYGQVQQGRVTMPYLDITQYNSAAVAPALTPTSPITTVSTNSYALGNPTFTIPGNLVLQGATLYVQGNLDVTGGISGNGAVIVHGNVTVDTGADVDATSVVALAASGDVTLNGASAQPKFFQGLVYTEGAFTANNITIAGAFVSVSAPDGTGSISSLTLGPNTQVVYVPAAVTIQGGTASAGSMSGVTPLDGLVTDASGVPITADWFNGAPPPGTTWMPDDISASTNPAIYQQISAAIGSNSVAQNGMFWGGGSGQGNNIAIGSVDTSTGNRGLEMVVRAIQYNPLTNQFDLVQPPTVFYGTVANDQPVSQAAFDSAAMPQGYNSTALLPLMVQSQLIFRNVANQLLSGKPVTTTRASSTSVPNLSLNNFLSDDAPIQVVSWREFNP